MSDSDSQKYLTIRNEIDVFVLARKQLEERRKIDEEQEQRWAIVARKKMNQGSGNEKQDLNNTKSIAGLDDSTLIFCGAPNSGKSTLLSRFIEFGGAPSTSFRQQPTEKSIALEYKFVNKILRGSSRQLVHCWELAGGGSMTNLLEIPFNQPSRIASILLFVDLTMPEQLQQITDPIMTFCRKQVEKWMITDIEPQQIKEESKIIKPLGIPLVLNFESERKRLTYRSIRQFAHINGASIITFSARIDSLMQKALLLLSNAVLDVPFPRTFATDPQQPLFVLPYGIDSFEKIDPSEESLINSISSYSEAMFNYIQSLNSAFPQLQQQIDDAGGGERDRRQQFDEPRIDAFVEERMRKLELHVRELQDRLKTEKNLENRQNI
ncbi:unnamed protein product [Meloidogyne enterolobii]|uniref:Uncharacterized protein n=1 Tax=Meloidogyne enterolobii TaxID=390850 RepID=A0ACB1B276_MELEN